MYPTPGVGFLNTADGERHRNRGYVRMGFYKLTGKVYHLKQKGATILHRLQKNEERIIDSFDGALTGFSASGTLGAISMETHTLKAQPRTVMGRATKALRDLAQIPGVVYGNHRAPQNVTVDRVSFIRTFREAGNSSLVELSLEEETVPVLIQAFQQHPISDFITHVDFLAVDLTREVEAIIRLTLVGEAPAVKTLGGTLVENVDELKVRALPTALVSHVDVDISPLAAFGDMIRVRDLMLPEGIRVSEEHDLNLVVAMVSAPRSEEEMAALENEVVEDVAAVEGTEKKPEEGEEGAKEEEAKEGGKNDDQAK